MTAIIFTFIIAIIILFMPFDPVKFEAIKWLVGFGLGGALTYAGINLVQKQQVTTPDSTTSLG